MPATWLSIRVDLVGGHGRALWPRPGRIFAAARTHTFRQLADTIDDAFARWDRSHLQQFTLTDGTQVADPDTRLYADDPPVLDHRRQKLSRLRGGEQFLYVFDLGDNWEHLCTVHPQRIDPSEMLGITPTTPLPYWGWGVIPDQYDRNWDGDDGESPPPPAPEPRYSDLPPLSPWWGSTSR